MKECTEDQVRNPKTNRCVKKNSKFGKEIMMASKSKSLVTKTQNVNKIDKLFFYSKSKNVDPGKGSNEEIQCIEDYINLKGYPNFRKVLSNFHVCPFKFEGQTYNSIEHVFQAKKIELVDKNKAFLFTLESGHEIGSGDGQVAQKNRKLVFLSKEVLHKWDLIKDDVMKRAAIQKYIACKQAREILLATNKAQLWHIVSRKKPVRFVHLEEIRAEIF
jgi:ribA/ribD-fused uncharacterized protein